MSVNREQFTGGEARHHRGQPYVFTRRRRGRGRGGGEQRPVRGGARPRRAAHGLRSDHALFPQPQGINRHTPSHHASSVDVAGSLASIPAAPRAPGQVAARFYHILTYLDVRCTYFLMNDRA